MEIQTLSKEIHRSKVQRARELTLDERLTAGATLYAEQLRLVREMIVGLHAEWTEMEVDAEIKRRRIVIQQLHEKQYYSNISPKDQGLVERS